MHTSMTSLYEQICMQAKTLGFDVVGLSDVCAPWKAGERLEHFVREGRHGEMAWMATTLLRRQHPLSLWPEARTALVLGMNYGPSYNPLDHLAYHRHGIISVYAQNADYHDLIKKRLKNLARWFVQISGSQVKVFVDTAPLMEKPLAEKAGLGWQGKHTNLVHREYGSWLFLGVMLTDCPLISRRQGDSVSSSEKKEKSASSHEEKVSHCGSCRACLDICPTQAFPKPYQLDARRCISYLTIEHKTTIPRSFRPLIGNRIYGCDDCLAVCPWNKFAQTAREVSFHPRPEIQAPLLRDLLDLDEQAFRSVFRQSPVKRLGRDRFLRNVLIAAGNSGDRELVKPVQKLLRDPATLVRAMAVWALSRLDPSLFLEERDIQAPSESDPGVCEEWKEGLKASSFSDDASSQGPRTSS